MGFGRLRTIKEILIFWGLVDKAGIPVVEGKASFGEAMEIFGLWLFPRQGVIQQMLEKMMNGGNV